MKKIFIYLLTIIISLFWLFPTYADLANTPAEDGNWYYYTNDSTDESITTVANNINGWWYVSNGKVDFNYNGFASNRNGDWYCENGKVNFDVNDIIYGEVKGINGWWYVANSKVIYGIETVAQRKAYGWWFIGKDGKVDFSMNTVAHNDNGWWVIENGKVNFGYNGLASNQNGLWYCVNGKVDFSYNDDNYQYNNYTYKIVNGKAYKLENAVFFGDSVAFGASISAQERYSKLLCEILEIEEKNFAVNGAGFYRYSQDKFFIPNQVNNVMSYQERQQTRFVFIEGGYNDFNNGYRDVLYAINTIDDMIIQIKKLYPNAKIYLLYGDDGPSSSSFRKDYDTAIKLINLYYKNYSDIYVLEDFNLVLNYNKSYYSDGIHPNAIGHRIIANWLYGEIQ